MTGYGARGVPVVLDVDAGELGVVPVGAAVPHEPEVALSWRLAGLIAGVGRGDRDAFTELYRLTGHRVFGLAVRILRSRCLAEEVAQEVYLQVWSQADRYDERMASPMGWMMMLTHRRAVDRVRQERSAAGREQLYGAAHVGRDHDVVSEAVEQRFEEAAVLRCLGSLTALQREAIELAYYGGRTYPEIADHFEISVSTVKSRVRDGLRRLSACLSGEDLL